MSADGMTGEIRGTGGNRFILGDSDRTALVVAVQQGLFDLHEYAAATGRSVDVGAITVTTRRIPSGAISVSVTGDLTYTPTRAVAVVDGATHAAPPSSLPEGDDRG